MKSQVNYKKSFRKSRLFNAISLLIPCGIQAANFTVTQPVDDGTGNVAGTLSWAILQSNINAGDDTITLSTDVSLTGVMKRLINSNVTINSDNTRRTVSGASQFRPLFIRSGQVNLQGFDIVDGLAQGGSGWSAGAGMGGGLFIYDGAVILNDLSFNNSHAMGGFADDNKQGGGGMFGDGAIAGGGLFESANQDLAGGGGYYGAFGRGGQFPSSNAYFGGGGGVEPTFNIGGSGGFGGASGKFAFGFISGGFGGGSDNLPGYAASRNGAGLGGAVFIRSGQVTINNTTFNNNSASAAEGAQGLGGGLFIMHTTINGVANNQGMPATLATVGGCGNTFANNSAADHGGVPNNNNHIFDVGNRTGSYPINLPCNGPVHLKVTEPVDDGTGTVPNTLSWAIDISNNIVGDDVITLETNVLLSARASGSDLIGYTGTPSITGKIKLMGQSHTIQRDGVNACTIDKNIEVWEFRLLHVGATGQLEINDLNLFNGCADSISNPRGGAVFNEGVLTVKGSTFADNKAQLGGAIGTLPTSQIDRIDNNTFHRNNAQMILQNTSANGSAISNEGLLLFITNNTFYQNHAQYSGVIEAYETSIEMVSNNLFVENTADGFADCAQFAGSVAGSNNMSTQNSDGCGIIDHAGLDPLTVNSLRDNGCASPNSSNACVWTHALTADSQAIDSGNVDAILVDQRGLLADGPRDLGAYEFGATVSDLIYRNRFE